MARRAKTRLVVLLGFQICILSKMMVQGQVSTTTPKDMPNPSLYSCVQQSVVRINASRGYMISPDYPKKYGNNKACTWIIQLTDEMLKDGQVVKFSTTDVFELESSLSICYDKLAIRGMTNSTEIDTQCGNLFTELVVEDSVVEIKFKSDSSISLRGFKILFEIIDPPPADMKNINCGLRGSRLANSSLDRIVGGTEAKPNNFPWQVALTYRDGSQFCGGTIVHPQWVVTAAHCVAGETAFGTIVKVGAHNLNVPGGSLAVQTIIMHPNYDDNTEDNDIALLQLMYPVTFTMKVAPACVAQNNASDYAQMTATLTGWGSLSSGGKSPDVLMQAKVTVKPMALCRRKYPNAITSSMICAGGSGKDTCQGDSGGPMVFQKPNGAFELIGITSWGKGCGDPGVPGVYTSVSFMGPWIRGYISDV